MNLLFESTMAQMTLKWSAALCTHKATWMTREVLTDSYDSGIHSFANTAGHILLDADRMHSKMHFEVIGRGKLGAHLILD